MLAHCESTYGHETVHFQLFTWSTYGTYILPHTGNENFKRMWIPRRINAKSSAMCHWGCQRQKASPSRRTESSQLGRLALTVNGFFLISVLFGIISTAGPASTDGSERGWLQVCAPRASSLEAEPPTPPDPGPAAHSCRTPAPTGEARKLRAGQGQRPGLCLESCNCGKKPPHHAFGKKRELRGLGNGVSPGFVEAGCTAPMTSPRDLGAPSPCSVHLTAALVLRPRRMEHNSSRLSAPPWQNIYSGAWPHGLTPHHPEENRPPWVDLRRQGLLSPRRSSKHCFMSHWLWLGHMPIPALIAVTGDGGCQVAEVQFMAAPGLHCSLNVNDSFWKCTEPRRHSQS